MTLRAANIVSVMGGRSTEAGTAEQPERGPRIVNEFGQPIGAAVDIGLPRPIPSHSPMHGRTCTLEPLDAHQHGRELFDAYAVAPDARGWTYLAGGPFDSSSDFVTWLDEMLLVPDAIFFTVFDRVGPCGIAAYLRLAPSAPSVEVGSIHFAPRLQRTVAATEAMFLMMQRAFETGYRRYEWKCDSLNAASRAAARRLGFTYEGDFRQAVVYKGRSRDTSWFSIVDSEWPQRRDEFRRWLDPANFDVDGAQQTRLDHHHDDQQR